jgi:hypothetical protein
MAKVTIELDDTSGMLEMGVTFPATGFDPKSQACQAAAIMVAHLDAHAERSNEKTETIEAAAPSEILAAGPSLVLVSA